MRQTIIFLLLCASSLSFSQKDSSSVLWRISGNGIIEPSYLFGTIHAVPGKQYHFSDSILNNLKNSQTLILEIETDIPLGEMVNIAKRMVLPNGKTIKDFIDSLQYNHLFLYLRDTLNIKEDKIKRYFTLKPVFLQSMVLMEIIDKPKALDSELRKIAGKKKDFIPLETLNEQMDMIDSIPFGQQFDLDTNKFTLKEEYYNLLKLYMNHDLDGIDSLMFSDPEFKNIEYNLLTRRNYNWVPKIEEAVKKEPCFIAVGCGHLIGKNGLIALLGEKGYTLKPVYFSHLRE